jgi:protein-S-isoprenylcysteine O-methyltransferase Ste14
MVIGPYAPSAIARWAFYACFWAWGLFEVWTGSRTGAAGSLDRDRLSRYAVLGVNLLSFTLAFFATALHRFDLTFFRPQLFYLGLALMLAGLVVRGYAIGQLGRFFTPMVIIQPGQHIVDTGLYCYLRHPSYTGSFITILGYGLALTNWLSLLIVLVLPGVVYAFRMRVEEAALCEAFGDEYRAYMRRTRRLIPFIY